MLANEAIMRKMERRIIARLMDISILSILNNDGQEISGYDLIKYFHNSCGLLMSPGTVYSHLHAIERKGWLKGRETEGKTIYSLTKQGKEQAEILLKAEPKIVNFVRSLFHSKII